MTIHVSVPPDLETKLREYAAAAGKDIETFALEALKEKILSANGLPAKHESVSSQVQVTEWLAWTANHPRLGYLVDDSRESIYAGREE